MLKDFYPVGMVASLLHHSDGVFYLMKTIYTTKVSVTKSGFVEIEIYSHDDGRFLTTYDFPLSEIKFYMETQLPGKAWFTLETIISIIEEVRPHLKTSYTYGNW